MAKRKQYDLVGYVYDKYNRFNNFTEEEIIKIPGVTFNSLEDIDRFTASFSGFYEFSNSLDDKYQKKTRFSIRIADNNGRYSYRSVIYNNPSLSEVIDKLKEDTITVAGKKRTVKLYTGSSTYFKDVWKTVEKKILEEDRDWFSQVFSGNWYFTLINQYFNRDRFESTPSITILDLERAFKDYEVFRKYLTNKDKVNNKSDKANNESTVSNVNVPSSTIPVKTSLGAIEDKLGSDISYVSSDEEKEEDEDVYDPDEYLFLSPEELEQMTAGPGNTFKGQNPKYSTDTGRRR